MSIVEVSLLQKMELAGVVLALALTAAPAVAGADARGRTGEVEGGHGRLRLGRGPLGPTAASGSRRAGSRGSTKGSTTS